MKSYHTMTAGNQRYGAARLEARNRNHLDRKGLFPAGIDNSEAHDICMLPNNISNVEERYDIPHDYSTTPRGVLKTALALLVRTL